MTETWAPVIGWESVYEVSDHGRVRRIKAGKGVPHRTLPYLLAPRTKTKGYLTVVIGGKERRIHHLVLGAFVGPAATGQECNHKNGVKDDNRLANLEWVTGSENVRHAFDTGLAKPATYQRNRGNKLTVHEAAAVYAYKGKEPHPVTAARFGISRSRVQQIQAMDPARLQARIGATQ